MLKNDLALQILKLVWLAIPLVSIFGWFFGAVDTGKNRRELGIEGNEFDLVSWHVLFGENRIGGALRDANRAIDALIGVNHQKIGTLAKTVDRADVHTVRELALDTVFSHDVSHGNTKS